MVECRDRLQTNYYKFKTGGKWTRKKIEYGQCTEGGDTACENLANDYAKIQGRIWNVGYTLFTVPLHVTCNYA